MIYRLPERKTSKRTSQPFVLLFSLPCTAAAAPISVFHFPGTRAKYALA